LIAVETAVYKDGMSRRRRSDTNEFPNKALGAVALFILMVVAFKFLPIEDWIYRFLFAPMNPNG
jgi:hypothetical protein